METQDEFNKKYLQYIKTENEKELSENADLISTFKEICYKKGLVLSDENFNYIYTIGIVASYPNLLGYLCPGILKDKEGLVSFTALTDIFQKKPFAKGFLYASDYMLMANPNFRRGLFPNNNFEPRFIDLFWSFKNKNIETFISLDFDRVRVNVDDTMYMERDTWYGAKFNERISDIKDDVVKLKPPSDLSNSQVSFIFSDVYALDIKWDTRDGIKSFYLEEFKNDACVIKRHGSDFYPVKYIHAEFDLYNNYFRHFDGAIHLYTKDEYYTRRDSDFNYNTKHKLHIKTASEKLFKMNGKIEKEIWIEFTSHFLSGNPLVMEYFEGTYPLHVTEILESIRKANL